VYEDPAYADVRAGLKRRLADRKRELGDRDDRYPEPVELRADYW